MNIADTTGGSNARFLPEFKAYLGRCGVSDAAARAGRLCCTPTHSSFSFQHLGKARDSPVQRTIVMTRRGGAALLLLFLAAGAGAESGAGEPELTTMPANLSDYDDASMEDYYEGGGLVGEAGVVPDSAPVLATDLPNNLLLLAGAQLNLSCGAEGKPGPRTVWTVRGEEVGLGDPLLITVTPELAGTLTCTATNTQGSEAHEIEVEVAATTRSTPGRSELVSSRAGEEVSLQCGAEVDPALLTGARTVWTREGEAALGAAGAGRELKLGYLVREMAGIYTCSVTTALDSLELTTRLEVEVAAPDLTTRPAPDLSLLVGQTGRLECGAVGLPVPELQWRRGEERLAGEAVVEGNTTSGWLEVTAPGTVTCQAVNLYGQSDKASAAVAVFSRTVLEVEPSSQTVESGSSVTLQCRARPDPRLAATLNTAWLLDSTPVDPAANARLQTVEAGLQIHNASRQEEGLWECRASTELEGDTAAGAARLTVLHASPAITSIPARVRVVEGGDNQLVCRASGLPAPALAWTWQGRPLPSSEGRLDLQAVGRHQEGEYTCR